MKRLLLFGFLLCLVSWTGSALGQSTAFGENAQQNGFSRALDVEGDRAFAGEPQNIHSPGRVYVFEQNGDGGWTEADAELAVAVRGSVAAPAE